MRKMILLLSFLLLLAAAPALAQKKYKVVPDSPEERALLEIQGETEAAKRIEMLDDFGKKFSSSEALPYTYQLYLAAYLQLNQLDKAIEFGEKAADADSEDIAVLVNLVRASQGMGDFARIHKWTAAAAPLVQKALANRPPDLDDDDWKRRQQTLKSYTEFLEYSLFDAATRDQSPEKLKYIDSFAQLFPQSERQKKMPAIYALAYGQANNVPKMMEYAEKAIATEPDNESMLLLVADSYVGQRIKLNEALDLARRLQKVMDAKTKPEGVNDVDWTRYLNTYQGGARSVVGRVLMLQEKTAPAIPELQAAAKMLEGNAPSLGPVLYFLGFAYAKLLRYNEARPVLSECVKLGGQYTKPCQDTLAKLPRAAKK